MPQSQRRSMEPVNLTSCSTVCHVLLPPLMLRSKFDAVKDFVYRLAIRLAAKGVLCHGCTLRVMIAKNSGKTIHMDLSRQGQLG